METTEKTAGQAARALRTGADVSAAAAAMGSITTEKKAAAVRENGKKGGRPKGQANSPEVRAKMQAAQAARRAAEAANKTRDDEAVS